LPTVPNKTTIIIIIRQRANLHSRYRRSRGHRST